MSAETVGRTVVLGVGNDLYRDDGVGVIVARELAAVDLPPEVAVIEGHAGGLNLLFDMEGAKRVIIVDAVDMGQPPGTVRAFRPDEAGFVNLENLASLHEIGMDHVLKLGALVGLTPEIHVVGIEPERVEAGFGLSPVVAQAVPLAVQAVRRLLGQTPEGAQAAVVTSPEGGCQHGQKCEDPRR